MYVSIYLHVCICDCMIVCVSVRRSGGGYVNVCGCVWLSVYVCKVVCVLLCAIWFLLWVFEVIYGCLWIFLGVCGCFFAFLFARVFFFCFRKRLCAVFLRSCDLVTL